NNGFGHLSLREAVRLVNANFGIDAITFEPTVFATAKSIVLGGTQLELSSDVSISGPAAGVTVNGNNASRAFQIDSGVTATLTGLAVTGGYAVGDNGGGIDNHGTLTLTNCALSGNGA